MKDRSHTKDSILIGAQVTYFIDGIEEGSKLLMAYFEDEMKKAFSNATEYAWLKLNKEEDDILTQDEMKLFHSYFFEKIQPFLIAHIVRRR